MKTGQVFLFKLNSPTEPVIVKRGLGTIDYMKGEIKLNPVNILSTEVKRGTNLIEIRKNTQDRLSNTLLK